MTLLIIFIVSFTGAFVSSISGGGSGIITVPVWLALNYSLPLAIACNKLSAVVWVISPARNYLVGKKVDWKLIFALGFFGLIGAYVGTVVMLKVDQQILKKILGATIILLVCFMYLKKTFGVEEHQPRCGILLTSLFAIPLGFYEAFFGTGNGIFSTLLLTKLRGLNLIAALGHYYCLAFVWCLFAAIIYISKGYYDFELMLTAIIGSTLGAHIGSRYAAKQGVGFVRKAFLIFGFIFGLILLIGD